MKFFRSLLFGGLAMFAAVAFLSGPARAVDYEPGVSVYSLEWPDIAIIYVVEVPAIILTKREAVPKPGTDAHSVAYAVNNQPHTLWRLAVDSYLHIDPHIFEA